MTRNGKDRLAAALGESYPRVWRGLGLEAKIARNLPDIQDKKRPRADDRGGHPYPAGPESQPYPVRRSREVVAVGGWERREAARAARGDVPNSRLKRQNSKGTA